jgi:hypothetical protein
MRLINCPVLRTVVLLLTLIWIAPVPMQGAAPVKTATPVPNEAPRELDVSSSHILPEENLKAYEERMNAYFAVKIAREGLDAVVNDEAGGYNQYRAFLDYWKPRLFGLNGDFKAYFELERNYYQNRRETRSSQRLAASAIAQEIGPITKPYGTEGAEGTGPIHFITFYNPSPSRMLCGSNAGGLFYSNNGGVTWSKTGTDTQIGRSGVGTAVFHPGDYKTWFAASAGNSGGSLASFIGFDGGIFRTTDEGATWTRIADQSRIGGIWTQVFKLSIHPTNANRLWAVTSTGLFETSNALSGTPVWLAVPALSGKYVYDFEIRPGNAGWLYATVADWSNGNLVNWRYMFSSNNGTTWQNVPGQTVSSSTTAALAIEVSPAKVDNLYCLTIHTGWQPSVLSIYDFGSNQWNQVNNSTYIPTGGGRAFGVDPKNWKRIFLSQGTEGRRYDFQSTPPFKDYLSTYAGGTYHPDIECLIHHPINPTEVWMSNHGGVYKSINDGVTWLDQSTGLGVAQVLRMATAASDPGYVALGLNHCGNIGTLPSWSNLWSPTWKSYPGFCDGLRPMIDPTTPQYIWCSCQSGAWSRSTDMGVTFSGNSPNSPSWIVEAVFNRLSPQTQFRLSTDSNGNHTVKRTTDHGNTWTQIADFRAIIPAASDYFIWELYSPETNGDYLLVHLLTKPNGNPWPTDNYLYRTKIANDTNAANVIASWEKLTVPTNTWLSDVKFDPADPNIVYISNSSSSNFSPNLYGTGMIFKVDYTNPAAHTQYTCGTGICSDLTQNLPNATVGADSLALERGSNSRLYFTPDFGGIWVSDNATRALGNGWAQLCPNLPNTSYSGLEINYVNNKIRAASSGRGVWEADLQVGCVAPPSNLALWLPLDEATGPVAANKSASFNGTYLGGPTPLSTGKVASALCFDGVDDHVDVPSYPNIDVSTADFSLDAWVQQTSNASGTDVLIDKRTDSGGQVRGYSLFLYNRQIGLQLADGTYANYISPGQTPNDGQWHLLAVTIARSSPTGVRFYLDGQPFGPTFNPTAHQGSLAAAAPFRIGARSALSSSGPVSAVLHGCLDEVEVFTRVLNADEVLSIYRAGSYGKCK